MVLLMSAIILIESCVPRGKVATNIAALTRQFLVFRDGRYFSNNGYQLLRFNPALNLWQPYSGSIFEPYRLPDTMALQWTVEGYRRDVNADILAPDDLFLNAQSFGDSDRQAETNKPLVEKFASLNNELPMS